MIPVNKCTFFIVYLLLICLWLSWLSSMQPTTCIVTTTECHQSPLSIHASTTIIFHMRYVYFQNINGLLLSLLLSATVIFVTKSKYHFYPPLVSVTALFSKTLCQLNFHNKSHGDDCFNQVLLSFFVRPCGTNIRHIQGNNSTLVLMHSGIVNGYQLLCDDAHTVLEPHRETAAFIYYNHYHPIPLFLFMCFHYDSLFFFLGCLYSLC